jgi:hypothetical protein
VRWACVVSALAAAAYLLLDPASADLAAQQYRAGLVREAGPGLWDNGWFAGHPTPAYSLLFPPLGAAIGVRLAGALSALAASALFACLARRRWGERAGTVAALWFAAGAIATLLSGRLAFLLGVAVGLATMLALQRAHHRVAVALAAATTLCSPVAGLFVALAAAAWGLAGGSRGRRVRGAVVVGAALAPALALGALFAEGGTEPFAASAFWPALAAIALVAAALPARERALRLGAAIYALACVAAFALPTPLGGNVTRLGALLAGPVTAGAVLGARPRGQAGAVLGARPRGQAGAVLGARPRGQAGAMLGAPPRGQAGAVLGARPRGQAGAALGARPRGQAGAPLGAGTPGASAGPRRRAWPAGLPRSAWRGALAPPAGGRRALAIALALPLAYWQAYPAVRDVARASGDPSTAAAYHAPLVRFLEGRPGSFRVEIPFTENHWEAAHVAPSIPLARGWERQLDRRYGALFYDGALGPARYRAWLDERAVAYVALPDVPLDHSARAEARLIARGLPYLRPVWRNAHWRVFAVRRPAPLVEGAASAIELEPDGFALRARRRGDALVRVHHTRWWAVTGGHACVERAPDGMTRVRVLQPGAVRVQARLLGSACRR